MPFLAEDGGWQFCKTRGLAAKHHDHDWGSLVSNSNSSPKSTQPGTLSILARATVVADRQNQAKLTTERNELPLGRKEVQSPDDAVQSPNEPIATDVRRECKYVGRPNGGGGGEVLLIPRQYYSSLQGECSRTSRALSVGMLTRMDREGDRKSKGGTGKGASSLTTGEDHEGGGGGYRRG